MANLKFSFKWGFTTKDLSCFYDVFMKLKEHIEWWSGNFIIWCKEWAEMAFIVHEIYVLLIFYLKWNVIFLPTTFVKYEVQ